MFKLFTKRAILALTLVVCVGWGFGLSAKKHHHHHHDVLGNLNDMPGGMWQKLCESLPIEWPSGQGSFPGKKCYVGDSVGCRGGDRVKCVGDVQGEFFNYVPICKNKEYAKWEQGFFVCYQPSKKDIAEYKKLRGD